MTGEKGNFERLILVRLGEITLKGLNRGRFVARLISNMRWRLSDLGEFTIEKAKPFKDLASGEENTNLSDDALLCEVIDRLSRIFGIVSVSPAIELEADWEALQAVVSGYAKGLLEDGEGADLQV